MAESFQQLDVTCPRCRAVHAARAFDRGHRSDWVVECDVIRVVAVSPPPRDGSVADELLNRVRRELEALLQAA